MCKATTRKCWKPQLARSHPGWLISLTWARLCSKSTVRWKKSSVLREMQQWFPRLLLIPSPPSSFNQTVNHLTVSYGSVAVPNCNVKVQGYINRLQDGLIQTFYQFIKAVCLVLEARVKNVSEEFASDTKSWMCRIWRLQLIWLSLSCVHLIKTQLCDCWNRKKNMWLCNYANLNFARRCDPSWPAGS